MLRTLKESSLCSCFVHCEIKSNKKQTGITSLSCLMQGSCTYYFEDEGFLRAGSVDSQGGDTKDTNGKNPWPAQAWHTKCWHLLEKEQETTQTLHWSLLLGISKSKHSYQWHARHESLVHIRLSLISVPSSHATIDHKASISKPKPGHARTIQ